MEAYILLFAAKNSIPISMVANLIDFAKNLSKALQGVKMDCTTATYKLREGLSGYQQHELIKKLKESNFSITIDKCTAKNSHILVSRLHILVSFYDEILKKVVIEHYESDECILVNSLTLLHKIDSLFKRDGIPWENLISDLSGNKIYMRGKKSGLEIKLHEKAPNMLDNGGNTCIVIHDAMRRFCHPFLCFVEKVSDDLNVDTKFSSDIKDYLQEICFMLSFPYLIPPQSIPHRWLSAYDCTNKILQLVDALYVLYYSWVPKADRHLYKDELNALYTKHSVTEISRKRLAKIQKTFQVKSLTEKGKEHKLHLVEKLIEQREKLFVDCQPLCFCFTTVGIPCTYSPSKKHEHPSHSWSDGRQFNVFFGGFAKYESITNLTSSQLKSFALNLMFVE